MIRVLFLLSMFMLLVGCAANRATSESTWRGPWNALDAERVVAEWKELAPDCDCATPTIVSKTAGIEATGIAGAFRAQYTKSTQKLMVTWEQVQSSSTVFTYRIVFELQDANGQVIQHLDRFVEKMAP